MIKAIYEQPIANIILNGEQLKAIGLILGTRYGHLLLPLLLNILVEVLRRTIRKRKGNEKRKRNKSHPNWKGRSYLCSQMT